MAKEEGFTKQSASMRAGCGEYAQSVVHLGVHLYLRGTQ